VEDRTKTENEIKKAEEHEAPKQTFLRLLDDPQIQQKITTLLSRRLGQIRGE
jgi:CRP-like cAMP-binding protein